MNGVFLVPKKIFSNTYFKLETKLLNLFSFYFYLIVFSRSQQLIVEVIAKEICRCKSVFRSPSRLTVFFFSRWPFKEDDVDSIRPLVVEQHMNLNRTESTALHEYIMK